MEPNTNGLSGSSPRDVETDAGGLGLVANLLIFGFTHKRSFADVTNIETLRSQYEREISLGYHIVLNEHACGIITVAFRQNMNI